jgi:hypothetical protein
MLTYSERAARIVARVMPPRPAPHGFYDPAGAIAHAREAGERRRLYWRTFARLRAKAEGGRPYITLPRDSGHIIGPGDAMYDVARELEGAA